MFGPKFSAFWMKPWDLADARRNLPTQRCCWGAARTRLDGRGHDHRHAEDRLGFAVADDEIDGKTFATVGALSPSYQAR